MRLRRGIVIVARAEKVEIVGKDTAEEKETFVIQIQHCENATWQGTVEWSHKHETKQFRSEVELIKLLDSAFDAADEQ